jgi:hypothetical protein
MDICLDIKEIQGRVGLRTYLRAVESIQRDWDSTQEPAKEEIKAMAAEQVMSQVFVKYLPVAEKDPIDLLVAPSSFQSKFSSPHCYQSRPRTTLSCQQHITACPKQQ